MFKTVLWVAMGVALIMGVAAIEKYYNVPGAWMTIARALIVIAIGLRVIRNIEAALGKNRAALLSQIVSGQEAGTRSLAWQQSVTGMYIIRLLLYASLVLVTIFAVGGTLSGFLVGGTLVSVMLGVAGQSFFANFFGGLAIALFKPFELGDHIQLIAGQLPILPETYAHGLRAQGYAGIIRDINLFYTELRLDDGQLMRVPNGIVISAGIIESQPQDWIRIHFRFDADAGLDAEKLLAELAAAAHRVFCPEDISESEACDPQRLRTSAPSRHTAPGTDPSDVAHPAQEDGAAHQGLGWMAPEVAIVDLSLSVVSIEIRASVPFRQRHARKEYFLRSVLPYLHAAKAP